MLAAGMVIALDAHSYQLAAPLAGSAYGLVWRAARIGGITGERQVALKFVNQAQMAQAASGQRQRWVDGAVDEAAFLRQLAPWDARHIVRLLDSGVHDGLPALALELMAGDLGAWVAQRRAAGQNGDIDRAFDWAGQVNQALAKVHQYGRRHLDLKPSNLLLNDDGAIVKLADFGTSRALLDEAPHVYAGTPNWQAPEQVFGEAADTDTDAAYRTSAATDYFALGALLYYLVTGGVALRFCRDAAQAWREGQLGAAARLRSRHRGAIPPTLSDEEAALFTQRCGEAGMAVAACRQALRLLRELLAPDPRARPPHALAIARMLAAIGAEVHTAPAWSLA